MLNPKLLRKGPPERPLTDEERKAQCAWICYAGARIECGPWDDFQDEWLDAYQRLTAEQKESHNAWKHTVNTALGETLLKFCPGGECCDPQFWKGGRLTEIHKGPVTP